VRFGCGESAAWATGYCNDSIAGGFFQRCAGGLGHNEEGDRADTPFVFGRGAVWYRGRFYSLRMRISRSGVPAAIALAGRLSLTSECSLTTALSPIVMPSRIVAPALTHVSAPMRAPPRKSISCSIIGREEDSKE
jgi:hypothetical protein